MHGTHSLSPLFFAQPFHFFFSFHHSHIESFTFHWLLSFISLLHPHLNSCTDFDLPFAAGCLTFSLSHFLLFSLSLFHFLSLTLTHLTKWTWIFLPLPPFFTPCNTSSCAPQLSHFASLPSCLVHNSACKQRREEKRARREREKRKVIYLPFLEANFTRDTA